MLDFIELVSARFAVDAWQESRAHVKTCPCMQVLFQEQLSMLEFIEFVSARTVAKVRARACEHLSMPHGSEFIGRSSGI